jgi:hypothetical protein
MGRHTIDRGRRSLWRYGASLPIAVADPVSLGDGLTPLDYAGIGSFSAISLHSATNTKIFAPEGKNLALSEERGSMLSCFP